MSFASIIILFVEDWTTKKGSFRSSCLQVISIKRCSKRCFKNFVKFRGNQLCQSLFLAKLQVSWRQIYLKEATLFKANLFKTTFVKVSFRHAIGLQPPTLYKKRLHHNFFSLNFVNFQFTSNFRCNLSNANVNKRLLPKTFDALW